MSVMDRHVVADAAVTGFRITDEVYDAGDQLHAHLHEDPHLVVLIEGSVEEQTPEAVRSLATASLIHFPASMEHSVRFPRRTALLSIEIDRDRQDLIRELHRGAASPFWVGSGPEILPITNAIRQELRRTGRIASAAIEGLTLQLIVKGIRSLTGHDPTPPLLRSARQYVETNFAGRIGLATVASALAVSPGHLARLHRDWFGMSVGQAIREVRIERAKEMIADGSRSLGEVALDVGFCDQPHFVHAFRALTGVTPSQYRRELLRAF